MLDIQLIPQLHEDSINISQLLPVFLNRITTTNQDLPNFLIILDELLKFLALYDVIQITYTGGKFLPLVGIFIPK
jgi:hypothetical protein